MSELYDNLLKATDNTNDITTEKYGVITKINGTLCSVKEYDTELEHSNVPIVNGADLKLGDKVIIGFLNNSIYDIVCYGVLDRTVEINWENVKDKPTVFPTDWENVKDKPTVFPTDWENVKDKPSTFPPSSHNHISSEVTDLINTIYPIGSIYMSINSTDPSELFGGEWERIKDTFLLASGDTYDSGSTGGEATHTLTVNEMPSHTHTQNAHTHTIGSLGRYEVNGKGHAAVGDGYGNTQNYKTGSTTATNKNTGGGQAHNNMPPYLAVNVWKRTA